MNIFGLNISRSNKTLPIQQEERSTSIENYFGTGVISFPNLGTEVTDITALSLSSVYRAVNIIGDTLASLPLEPYIYTDNILTVDRFHYSYNMLNIEPHPLYSRFMFWKTLIGHVLLNGNGYAFIKRKPNGDPENLILLDPFKIEVLYNKELREVRYRHQDVLEFIHPNDIIHIINYSINGYSGNSVIYYGSRVLGIALAADKTAKGFYESGANVNGILTSPGVIGSKMAEKVKANWANSRNPFVSTSTPGSIAVLENGMTYQQVGVSPADAQLLESRKWNVEEVGRFFGVHPSKLYSQTSLTYSNIEQNSLDFLQSTMRPLIEKVENELYRKLFRPSVRSQVVAKFNEDTLLRTDLETKALFIDKMMSAGAYTHNDAREKLGLPPVEGGDVLIVKSGYQPLDKLSNSEETNNERNKNSSKGQSRSKGTRR